MITTLLLLPLRSNPIRRTEPDNPTNILQMKRQKRTISNLLSRLITGIVYISIILFGIVTDSVALLGAIFFLFASVGCYEFQTVTQINKFTLILKILHSLMAGLIFYTIHMQVSAQATYREVIIATLPYMAYYLFYIIGEMYRNRKDPLREIAFAFFSHLYIAIPLGLLMLLCVDGYQVYDDSGVPLYMSNTFWLLPIFIFIWLNDTGAYLFGSIFGRHKLWERISPKKTVEGAVGGVVTTLLGAGIFFYFFPYIIALPEWLILAALISIFSTWGDLFESYLKRAYGVKDSGRILPGHGGILDRIDSLLVSAIPAYIFITILVSTK